MGDPDEILRHDTVTYVVGERDGKKVPVPYFVGKMPKPPDSLDAAWAEAEAALPEGWPLSLKRWTTGPYVAVAGLPAGWPDYLESGQHTTPAAALRALAAKLRERG